MTIFLNNLGATADVRGSLLVDLAQKRRLRTATGYLHSSIGLNSTGEIILLMKTGSLLDIGATHYSLGSDRAILLDNGGSVGAAYWSQFAWKRSGWDAIQNQPAFLGNGSYFRPRGHSIFMAELARDLPDGPTANVIQSTSATIP